MFKLLSAEAYLLIFKTKFKFLITLLSTFFLPITPMLITVGLFIFADTIIGLYRSFKRKDKITSKKLSNIASKTLLYESTVLLMYLLEKFIIGDFVMAFVSIPFFCTKLLAATLCLIELKSIDESIEIIKGYSIWDKFKQILKRAKSIKEELAELDFTKSKKEEDFKKEEDSI